MNCGIKAGIVSIYQAESKGFATTQACKEIFNPNVASEEQIESEGGRHRTEVYAASRVPLILPIRLGRFGRVVWDADRARPGCLLDRNRVSHSCLGSRAARIGVKRLFNIGRSEMVQRPLQRLQGFCCVEWVRIAATQVFALTTDRAIPAICVSYQRYWEETMKLCLLLALLGLALSFAPQAFAQ